MKIGEFAKKFNLNKTTIRYYTENNMLIPINNGTYSDYDLHCERDMRDIIRFKGMGFSIEEIKNIKMKERFFIYYSEKDHAFIKGKLEKKLNELKDQMSDIESKIKEVQGYILECEEKKKREKYGINVSALEFLSCPKCNEKFDILDANIKNLMVISGKLSCKCGREFSISDGIIRDVKNLKEDLRTLSTRDHEVLNNSHFVKLKRVGTLINSAFDKWDHSRGILFINADTDIHMYKLEDSFRDDGVYIFAFYDKNTLELFKEKVEVLNCRGNFIFIQYVHDIPLSLNIPYLIDISGCMVDKVLNYEGHAIEKFRQYFDFIEESIYINLSEVEFKDKRKKEYEDYLDYFKNMNLKIVEDEYIGDFSDVERLFNQDDDNKKIGLFFMRFTKLC